MKLILNIFILFFASAYTFSSETELTAKLPLASRVFSSGIYDIYLNQMQDFVSEREAHYPEIGEDETNEFQIAVQHLIQMTMQGPLTADPELQQAFHEKMVGQLRKAIALKEQALPEHEFLNYSYKRFVDDLCVWIFTSPQLLHPLQNYMEGSFPTTFPQSGDEGRWVEQLAKLHYAITPEEYGGVVDSFSKLHNAHFHGDVPSYLGPIFSGNKEIKLIRTSNVTYDYIDEENGDVIAAKIMPEFINYLGTITAQGKKHLYVNYIQRQGDSVSSSRQIKHIENLDVDPRFGEAVSVVSLARNSIFYRQESQYLELNDAAEFKAAFIDELFADPATSNYYWSKSLNISTWKETVETILDEVHFTYFDGSGTLSVEDRQQFIDVAYVKMTQRLMDILRPDIANLSCAITIDRGPTGYTLFLIDYLLQQKGKIDLTDLKKLTTLVYSPGVLVRNRAIVPHHYGRFIQAAERLRARSLSDVGASFQCQ